MKTFFSLLLIMVMSCKSTTNTSNSKTVSKEANTTETSKPPLMEVENIMNYLTSDDLLGREAGTDGIATAATYIKDIFDKNNIEPYFSTYNDTLSNFDPVTYNVVGYLEGNDSSLKNEFVVLGAHYDHIGSAHANEDGDVIANGANDNAAGTTAVLELAKHFGYTKSNKRSILFVLFSAEEKGLLGSAHLAKKLKEQNFNLYTMVNFEMIGVPMTTEYKAYITGYEESNMADKINEYADKELIGFLAKAKEYNLFQRSDNYPFFQEFNLPAQTISTFDFTNYEYYHHVDDEVSEMDFEHMESLIKEMMPVIEKITNSATQEIKMND